MEVSHIRRALPLAVLVAIVVTFAAVLYTRPGGDFVTRSVNDIAQAVAALAGGVACWWRSRRSHGRMRLSWALIGSALLGWAGGEVVWSYYEIIARRETPVPSYADLGFLLLPALALPGLLVRPSTAFANRARYRVLLEGVMIAGSLFTLSWATSLGVVYEQGAQNAFAFAVSLAYPAGDVLMVTVAVGVFAHASDRSGLAMLVVGLVLLGVADSGFLYLVAVDNYSVVSYPDVAWVAAFLLIGVTAITSKQDDTATVHRTELGTAEIALGSPLLVALPYAVVGVGLAAQLVLFSQGRAAPVTLVVEAVALVALFLRQLVVVLDNRRMAADIMAQQEQLRFRAFHDALTGLANRALFRDRLSHALDLHRRDGRGVAVVLIDLDDFKSVNDSFGHHAGDALLVAVGERLTATTRTADTVARLGGDEFAVLCEDDGTGDDVDLFAGRLLSALTAPVVLDDCTLTVRASLGTVSIGVGDETPTDEELLKRADIAMYVAKQAGKAMAVAFSPALAMTGPDDLTQRFALVDDVHAGRLDVAVQPIVRPDGTRFAFEALARWRHDGVQVPPDHFVPLAERAGVLPELDLLVAARAIAHVRTIPGDAPMSINLGLPTMRRHDLVDRIVDLLDESGLEPARLMVEIPEGRAIASADTIATIERLRALGILLAVDDFGIGYSNLARLAALMPDIIKFDKTLVQGVGRNAAADRLLAGAIDLAHDLGARVVAEGVEHPHQHALLTALGCDSMQGFLLGRPELIGGHTESLAVA